MRGAARQGCPCVSHYRLAGNQVVPRKKHNQLLLIDINGCAPAESALARSLISKGSKRTKQPMMRGVESMKRCNESIMKTFDLVNNMLSIADEGDAVREDVGCGVLYGVMRDAAFKIKRLAEAEKAAHEEKGWWQGTPHRHHKTC